MDPCVVDPYLETVMRGVAVLVPLVVGVAAVAMIILMMKLFEKA